MISERGMSLGMCAEETRDWMTQEVGTGAEERQSVMAPNIAMGAECTEQVRDSRGFVICKMGMPLAMCAQEAQSLMKPCQVDMYTEEGRDLIAPKRWARAQRKLRV
mmetsp:Transcript_1324/g.2401  ORF Transcript_1324/g.2401 Transcript_1324/m.2401 type:complete len:106 (-) Transcript_1324:187-504(-)